ncbi:MAG: hypothetical protein Salg2KO_18630 [Salibacteraceae bacterium]
MNSTISIRPAFYDDEQEVLAIMNQAIAEKKNAYITEFDWVKGSEWYKRMRDTSSWILLAMMDDQVVGWGNLSDYRGGREAFARVQEISFYVHQDFRRMGVASRLISELEIVAQNGGIRQLVAMLLDDNLSSRALLEKNGYFVWGLFENIAVFEDKTRGHLYMGKAL